jgi:hypothetical protein
VDRHAAAGSQGLEVGAGAEALAGAGEDRHREAVVAVEVEEGLVERGGGLGVDGVARFGSGDGDHAYRTPGLHLDLAHVRRMILCR